MNCKLEVVPNDKHLGCLVGNISQKERISHGVNDFIGKVNMLKCHFGSLPPNVTYSLFKSHCMPLYASALWDLSHPAMEKFFIAWRKSIRSILHLPLQTHSRLLHHICNDVHVKVQLYNRLLKFVKAAYHSGNSVTRLCAHLASQGSCSAVSNSISLICFDAHFSRNSLFEVDNETVISSITSFVYDNSDECNVTASIIRDLLHRKWNYNMQFDCNLSMSEINVALHTYCVE